MTRPRVCFVDQSSISGTRLPACAPAVFHHEPYVLPLYQCAGLCCTFDPSTAFHNSSSQPVGIYTRQPLVQNSSSQPVGIYTRQALVHGYAIADLNQWQHECFPKCAHTQLNNEGLSLSPQSHEEKQTLLSQRAFLANSLVGGLLLANSAMTRA